MLVDLNPQMFQSLQYLAADTERSPEDLVREAVTEYIDYHRGILAAVEEGRAAGQRGDMLDHEEVMAMMDEIILHG